jgi:hypothetical protein
MALRQLICFLFYKTCAKKLNFHGQFFKKNIFFQIPIGKLNLFNGMNQ